MPAIKPKIVFVLNTFGLTGGVKVIFEHANCLAAKGYEVSLIHLLSLRPGLKNRFIAFLKWCKYHVPGLKKYSFLPRWFNLHPLIRPAHQWKLKNIPADALVIATANETADAVEALKIDVARKFYFIQDYESWTRNPKEVDRTYSYNLKKIVISRRLQKLLQDRFQQESSGPVNNGVNAIFLKPSPRAALSSANQPTGRILSLYNPAPHKGFASILAAFQIIKDNWPSAELIIFGAQHLPCELASLGLVKEFYFQPAPQKIKELYQSSDIFIYGALEEGFALTPLEAMASGCAVVSSDVGAVTDYGQDGKSIIIVPPGNPEALAQAALGLLKDRAALESLAVAGRQAAREYTWEKASDHLEEILLAGL